MLKRLWWWSDVTWMDTEVIDHEVHLVDSESQLRTELLSLHMDMQDMGYVPFVWGKEDHGCDICPEWEAHSFLLVDNDGSMVHDVLIRELIVPVEARAEIRDGDLYVWWGGG